jgi:glutathione S-transferase
MTLMMVALIANSIKTAPVPFFIRPITGRVAGNIQSSFLNPNFATHFAFLEDQLKTSGGNYLCGPNLTGADILLSFPLIAGGSRAGLTKEKYPTLHTYVQRLENEPGYKRSTEKIVEIEGKFEATL